MRECMKELYNLLLCHTECIWVNTIEEKEFIDDLNEMLTIYAKGLFENYSLNVWSCTSGVVSYQIANNTYPRYNDADYMAIATEPPALFKHIYTKIESNKLNSDKNIWVLRELSPLFSNPKTARMIRDFKESLKSYDGYNPIIVVDSSSSIPSNLTHLFKVFDYELPNKKDLTDVITTFNTIFAKSRDKFPEYESLNEKSIQEVVNSCIGLTLRETKDALFNSVKRENYIKANYVTKVKVENIRKQGIIDYKIPELTFDDLGGISTIKEYLKQQAKAFSKEARQFGVAKPKGVMLVGIPGSGKTAIAEAFANYMKVPFIELEASKIMSRLVGESERNIAHALNIVRKSAPCVLLIDEAEKLLGGVISSNQVDSGITARIFQQILRFMNDDSGVYVMMTSNDVSQLPPELTRAGRLDSQWYFGLPSATDKKQILKLYLKKAKQDMTDLLLNDVVTSHMQDFTAAEVKQAVQNAMRIAYFKDHKKVTKEDLVEGTKEVIPVATSSREWITALETWCKGRARNVSETKKESESKKRDKDDVFFNFNY